MQSPSCSFFVPPPPGDINSQDTSLISTHPTWSNGSDPDLWDAKRQLLGKIKRYPGLMNSNQQVADFYAAHLYTSPDLFARFDSMLEVAYSIPVSQIDSLRLIQHDMDSVVLLLTALDDSINDTLENIEYIPAALASSRQAYLNQLGNLMVRWAAQRTQIAAPRTPLLNYCEAYNHTLPDGTQHEANQKVLNTLLIKYGRGEAWTVADYNALRFIANQCPEVAGKTRDRAISRLPAHESPYYLSDRGQAALGCGQQKGLSHVADPRLPVVQLIPNPASQSFRIFFPVPYSGPLSLTDISGRTVFVKNGLQQISQLEIPTQDWAAGLYWVKADGYPVSKLVVIR